jgi:hypothetical protein
LNLNTAALSDLLPELASQITQSIHVLIGFDRDLYRREITRLTDHQISIELAGCKFFQRHFSVNRWITKTGNRVKVRQICQGNRWAFEQGHIQRGGDSPNALYPLKVSDHIGKTRQRFVAQQWRIRLPGED